MKSRTIYFLLIILSILGLSEHIHAQTSSQNYIHLYDVQQSEITDPNSLTINTYIGTAIQTIQYFDGLGRPIQTVQKGVTPEGYDLIKPNIYNNVGIDETNFEPYSASPSTGGYRDDFKTTQPQFYDDRFDDNNGKSPTFFEPSPLNRILKQGAPGAPWQLDNGDHFISFSYLSNNNSNLKAILWKVIGNDCSNSGYYSDNQLYVIKTTGEDGSETLEFKDKQGQVILKRSVLNTTTNVDTYYVYDDYGLLRFVISPEGAAQITGSFNASTELARKFVYCYTYDARKRLIEKQVPGKEPEYYVYDKTDKVIMFQDGNMRKIVQGNPAYEWMFTKYDAMGRVIMTGITFEFPNQSRQYCQDKANEEAENWEYINSDENTNYYSNLCFPAYNATNCRILSVNYYDSYHVWKQKGTDFEKVSIYQDNNLDCLPPNSHDRISQPELNHVAGFPTVNYTCVLYPYESGNDPGNLFASVTYYDVKGRLLQSHSKNHCNGYDHFTNQYVGLTNLVLSTHHRHSTRFATINDVTETIVNGYDPVGRLVEKRYFFQDETPKTVITNTYNTLGQLISKQIGDGTYLMQTVDYEYNIRGWLTKINNPNNVSATGDLFGMELLYNIQNTTLQNTPAFNGNISAAIWQTVQPTGTTTPVTTGIKSYKYSYDNLNRLLSGVFTGNTAQNENYSEYIDVSTMVSGTTPYDLNGNILTLRRYGKRSNVFNTIDELTYTYDGNKLIAVDDVVATDNGGDFYEAGKKYIVGGIHEYIYDANGNLTTDDNKKIISITYNHLNLPATINKTGGNRIVYTYDASGNKVRQDYYINGTITKTTDFIGNFVYENGLPSCIVYDEGRVVYANNSRTYFGEIYLKDHLGNVRIACRRENGVLKTRQVDSYYPFGMNIKGLTANSTDVNRPNEYLYNGKMMQDEMGLGWLDYGARFYDAVLGRWHSVDPKANIYYPISPYVYVANNPIIFIDPDGRKLVFANGATEEFKNQFAAAVSYLNANGASGILSSLEKSSKVYTIAEMNGISNFDAKSSTLNWDPSLGLLTTSGKNLSPTSVLNHEADHANQWDKHPEQFIKDVDPKTGKDAQFGTKEEKRVIEGSEQVTAEKLGEIKQGEQTRNDHGGTLYSTTGPTSTEPKITLEGVDIISTKKDKKDEE